MDVFWKVFEKEGNNPNKHGNLFECIESMKFNIDSSLKNSDLKAEVNAITNRTAKADISFIKGNKVVGEVQAKCWIDTNKRLAEELESDSYKGMQRLVPTDKEKPLNDFLEKAENRGGGKTIYSDKYKDFRENLTGKLRNENVSSGGTSYKETIDAKENPQHYSSNIQKNQLKSEAAAAGLWSAGTGFVITGGISAVKNLIAVKKDEKTLKEAGLDSLKDGIDGGVKSGVIGAGGAVIRFGAKKAGIEAFAKASLATAIAAGIVDTGVTLYSFVKGDIEIEEAMERLGQNEVSTVYALFAGSAVSAVIPGAIAPVVATTAGYLLANFAYQSCIAIFRQARLTEAQSERIIAICEESIQQMRTRRAEFERWFEQEQQIRNDAFSACFESIDIALNNDNHGQAVSALADFADLFGKKLKFENI